MKRVGRDGAWLEKHSQENSEGRTLESAFICPQEGTMSLPMRKLDSRAVRKHPLIKWSRTRYTAFHFVVSGWYLRPNMFFDSGN